MLLISTFLPLNARVIGTLFKKDKNKMGVLLSDMKSGQPL